MSDRPDPQKGKTVWMRYAIELEDENTDLRAACEQKQEIINSFDAVDKARMAENALLREEFEAYKEDMIALRIAADSKFVPPGRAW
jgi:hypothetical protein